MKPTCWLHKRTLYCLVISLFAVLPTSAQLNTLDSTRLIVKLSSAGSLLEGNVSRFLLANRLDVNYAGAQWGFSNRTDYQYGIRNHLLSENDVTAYDFLYYRPASRFYPFLMTILETNYRRKVRFRYQVGPGVTHTLLKKPAHLLRGSLSFTYEHTRFGATNFENLKDTSRIVTTVRLTPRLFAVHRLCKGKLFLSYEAWWQQSVSLWRNYRFLLEQSIEAPLIKHLDLRSTIRYTQENIRLKGLKAYDLFWVFGIVIKNY